MEIIAPPEGKTVEQLVSRIYWLAFKACGGPMGMGVLQDRPGIDEAAVAKNVATNGDYVFNPGSRPGRVYGDYVFGRMMKLGIEFTSEGVKVSDSVPRIDYQAWCGRYPTYRDLIKAAVATL